MVISNVPAPAGDENARLHALREIASRLQQFEEFGQALLRALAHDEGQAEIAFVAQLVDGDAVFGDHRAPCRRAATARAAVRSSIAMTRRLG